jgi:RHS repeat-associated protein
MDFLPYGEQTAGGSGTTHKFTGKERDFESGLDNFGARYYASSMGRFMSPDWSAAPTNVPYAAFGNPQSLNLYSYVQNNPTSSKDANGHHHCDPDTAKWGPNSVTVTAGACYSDWWDWPILKQHIQDLIMCGLCQRVNTKGLDPYMRPPLVSMGLLPPLPPLRIIHLEPSLQTSASYQDWNKKSTQDIIDSLKPGAKEPLTVYPDGGIAQGNTRITILKERGIDVDGLPRVTRITEPIPEPGEPAEPIEPIEPIEPR